MTPVPKEQGVCVLDQLFGVRGLGVVVTGAASGLGLAIADVLARCGANVTLADVDETAVERATVGLLQQGLSVRSAVVDVSNHYAVEELMASAAKAEGGLQVVFANAGISSGPGPLSPTGGIAVIDPSSWDRVVSINLRGVLSTIQAAAKNIADDGRGRIIVTSSVAGLRAEPMVGYAYAATKAAVLALVRQAAQELAGLNIRINAIAPGGFRTNIGAGRIKESEVADSFAARSALRRIGHPDEIKGLAVFLASPSSSYVTGTAFVVDGGTV